jgi:hypothetical protein
MPITYNNLSLQNRKSQRPNTQFQSLIRPQTRRKGKHGLDRNRRVEVVDMQSGLALPTLNRETYTRTDLLRIAIHREGELVGLDVRRIDHQRPLFDFGLMMRGKGQRRLLVASHEFLPDLGNSLIHSWVA